MKILNHSLFYDGYMWTFRSEDDKGCYCTNDSGEGLFFQSDRTGNVRQLIGTCQFSSCVTRSGMLRKCKAYLDTRDRDPII